MLHLLLERVLLEHKPFSPILSMPSGAVFGGAWILTPGGLNPNQIPVVSGLGFGLELEVLSHE